MSQFCSYFCSPVCCWWVLRSQYIWWASDGKIHPQPIPSTLGKSVRPRIWAHSWWWKVVWEWIIANDRQSSISYYISSFDAELHLVHYKSTYDNISAAVADGQPDSLAVVGIFMREATTWDQWRGAKDSDSVNHLKMAALELSRNWKGPAAPSAQMEVVMDQFLSGIT